MIVTPFYYYATNNKYIMLTNDYVISVVSDSYLHVLRQRVREVELFDDLGERGALRGLVRPTQFDEVDYVRDHQRKRKKIY